MSFTFETDIGKVSLVIYIYNFLRAKQNYIDGAVLNYIAMQHALMNALGPPTHLIGKILGRCKYKLLNMENITWY